MTWLKLIMTSTHGKTCGLQHQNGAMTHTCSKTRDFRQLVLVIYATWAVKVGRLLVTVNGWTKGATFELNVLLIFTTSYKIPNIPKAICVKVHKSWTVKLHCSMFHLCDMRRRSIFLHIFQFVNCENQHPKDLRHSEAVIANIYFTKIL